MPPGIQPAGSHPQLGGAGAEPAASPVTMQFSASPTAVAASATDSGYHKAAPYQTPPNRMPPGIQPAGSHPQLGGDASPVTMGFAATDVENARAALERSVTGAVSPSDSGYHKAAPYQTPPNRMQPGIQPAGSHPQLGGTGAGSAASPVTMQFSAAPAATSSAASPSATDSG